MERCVKSVLTAVIIMFIVGFPALWATWEEDGTPICAAAGSQQPAGMISDGFGGTIIVWSDGRAGAPGIYAQRTDPYGNALWQADGVAVCSDEYMRFNPSAVPDGSGGAIVSWIDLRNTVDNIDIYAQRVDADGNVLWTAGGVPVCSAAFNQMSAVSTEDGQGGVIIAWHDERGMTTDDVYAQRLDGGGNALWTADGIPVCLNTAVETDNNQPRIISDGAGGAIVSWVDTRGGASLYAQRIDENGDTLWAANGIAVSTGVDFSTDIWNPISVTDGAGGAIFVYKPASYYRFDSQRIDHGGNIMWDAGGQGLSQGSDFAIYTGLVTDGQHGAIVVWMDFDSSDYELRAQRIDAGGDTLWTEAGVAVGGTTNSTNMFSLASGGHGDVIVTWEDNRGADFDIYSQKIDSTGANLWDETGIAISTATSDQLGSESIPNGFGGAFITWWDKRSDDGDIYAHRVETNGFTGYYPTAVISAVQDIPNDQGGRIEMQWDRSYLDLIPYVDISFYSVWRRRPKLEIAGRYPMAFDASAGIPEDFEGQAIRSLDSEYAWEWIENVPARYFDTYSITIESLCDSSAAGPGWQHFMVSAQTDTPYVFYDSPVDSGYSVDNLAPGAPLGLAGEQSYVPEGLELSWSPNEDVDLAGYMIYRGTDPGFTPGPGNLLTEPCDTFYMDGDWRWDSGYCYKVAAFDVHGNIGTCSTLFPDQITGAGERPRPAASFLRQNHPNPFNPATTIVFGTAKRARVSLRIYDAAGRLVRELVNRDLEAARHEVEWDGRDDSGRQVASGIYFYRIIAGEFTRTRKMALIR